MNTMQMSKTMAILGCAVLLGALAGCADEEAPPAEQPSESTPAGSEEPDPAPVEPTDTTPADPEESEPAEDPGEDPGAWIIDDSSVGPIEMGADFETVLADVPGEWTNDEMCAGMAFWNAADGSYLISFRSDAADGGGAIAEITVEGLAEGAVGPRTSDGLGLGSTEDDVMGAHPNTVPLDASVGGGTFLRADSESPLFFTYPEGGDAASRVTVTSRDLPSYEACA